MLALCVLLATLSLFLLLKLIYQRKLIRELKKQIDFLIDRDTQTEIMVEQTDGPIQALAASINHLLKKYRSMGQEIERSDTLFRDTITSLSHDLRTPLATANGYIQLLQEQDLTGEQKEYVSIAGERISAVKLLLDQLFEFARIEAVPVLSALPAETRIFTAYFGMLSPHTTAILNKKNVFPVSLSQVHRLSFGAIQMH